MPKLTYNDMTLSVSPFGGDVTVAIRSLTKKIALNDLAALVYPTFDAEEKAQAAASEADTK
jgi:hypothetical protein